VRGQGAVNSRRRQQRAEVDRRPVSRVRQLAEQLVHGLTLTDRPWLGVARVPVVVGAPNKSGGRRTEEEQPVFHERSADRTTELIDVVLRLRILHEADRLVVGRPQHETLNRTGAEWAARSEEVAFTVEGVAA